MLLHCPFTFCTYRAVVDKAHKFKLRLQREGRYNAGYPCMCGQERKLGTSKQVGRLPGLGGKLCQIMKINHLQGITSITLYRPESCMRSGQMIGTSQGRNKDCNMGAVR